MKLPDPKCRPTGMSAASQASQNGSQKPVWNDGSPSGTGLSAKLTARKPFPASHSTSAAASAASHTGTIPSGMNRSGAAAHHSSMLNSFHARTQRSARSLSCARANTLPAKPGNDGKHSVACTPSRSMSLTRCTGS
jgi:hypothetical protein